MQRPNFISPRRDRRIHGVLWCLQSRIRLHTYATMEGHSLHVKTTKEPRAKLHYARSWVGSGGVRSKNLETLPVRYQMHYIHRSQNPTSHTQLDGTQYEATMMSWAVERLRVRDSIPSGQSNCHSRCPEPEKILGKPSKVTNYDHPFSPVFTNQGGLTRSPKA